MMRAAVAYLMSLSVEGSVGRALLVAALLISAYALALYWRNLRARPAKVRYALVSLRALSLVLLACALAGLKVEYESGARPSILLVSSGGVDVEENAPGDAGTITRRQHGREEERAIAALRGQGFDVVEENAEARTGSGFVASLFVTDGAMSAESAERAVEGVSAHAGDAPVFVLSTDHLFREERSVVLEKVTTLGRALRGVPLTVRCTIHARGMRGRESLLTVSDDAKVQASARVRWTGDDERQSVTVTLVPKIAGWVDYSAKVEAVGTEGAGTKEAGTEEAAGLVRSFAVYAEERRLRVLFFEGEPTWEAKFIRRALEQSGLFEVDYSAQVSRAAAVGMSEEAAEQNKEQEQDASSQGKAGAGGKSSSPLSAPEAKLRTALRSAAALNAYDSVIVGAAGDALLSRAESARLGEWVERRGGGLIVLGGNGFSGSIAAPGGKLYSLLPAEAAAGTRASAEGQEVGRGRPLEAEKTSGGVWLTPTEAGANGPLGGYLSASEGETAARAGILTGQGLRLGALRPGALALAVGARPGANGLSEEGSTLIAAMRYGQGRTLIFAPADSWRIRTSASGDEDSAGSTFNALWQGLVLWTSAGAAPPASIVLSDDAPAEGSELIAEIHVRDLSFAPLKIEKLSARLQPLTENAGAGSPTSIEPREINFAPAPTDKSVWRARFRLSARGRFLLEAEYEAGASKGLVEKYFAVVTESTPETGAALDTLRRVARERGGEMVEASNLSPLLERLAAMRSKSESVRRTWELRNWWPLAFLIPLLLSTEWFLRRWWKEE